MISRIALPRLETMPQALAVVRTMAGRLALVAGFTALLGVLRVAVWWQTGVFLALTSLFPERRRVVLAIAALSWIYWLPPLNMDALARLAPQYAAERWVPFWPVAVALVWLFAIAYVSLVRRFPASPVGRRPVLSLVAILVALLIAAHTGSTGLGWFLVAASALVLGSYLWFFAYWIADRRSARGWTNVPVGYCRPFWGFTHTPFGKGAAYLDRVEVHTDDDLATVQLKGLKLLIWAGVLKVVYRVSQELLWGSSAFSLHGILPTYETAFEQHLAGDPFSLPLRWISVILRFVFEILNISIMGHTFIAVCRMAGFNAFRNVYRPLTAPTISEFFNRIGYYFKELLATFFFYPTYLRYFKRRPALRLFAATLTAAGFGNFLFHFLRDDGEIIGMGMWDALIAYQVYAAYALILGVAIAVSQIRARSRKPSQLTGWRRARAVAGVLFFYCLLGTLDVPTSPHTIFEYGSFLLSLFWP